MPVLLVLISVISLLVQVVIALVIVQFVVSLLFAFNVVNPHNEIAGAIYRTCNMLLDPVLRPIQKIMPDTRPIDLSPMVLIFGLTILQRIIVQAANQGM
jgi:YggT family protein